MVLFYLFVNFFNTNSAPTVRHNPIFTTAIISRKALGYEQSGVTLSGTDSEVFVIHWHHSTCLHKSDAVMVQSTHRNQFWGSTLLSCCKLLTNTSIKVEFSLWNNTIRFVIFSKRCCGDILDTSYSVILFWCNAPLTYDSSSTLICHEFRSFTWCE